MEANWKNFGPFNEKNMSFYIGIIIMRRQQ